MGNPVIPRQLKLDLCFSRNFWRFSDKILWHHSLVLSSVYHINRPPSGRKNPPFWTFVYHLNWSPMVFFNIYFDHPGVFGLNLSSFTIASPPKETSPQLHLQITHGCLQHWAPIDHALATKNGTFPAGFNRGTSGWKHLQNKHAPILQGLTKKNTSNLKAPKWGWNEASNTWKFNTQKRSTPEKRTRTRTRQRFFVVRMLTLSQLPVSVCRERIISICL